MNTLFSPLSPFIAGLLFVCLLVPGIPAAASTMDETSTPSSEALLPGAQGELRGEVLQRGTRRPVESAEVHLRGDTERVATTNTLGRFRFSNLAPGNYTLSVLAVGYRIPEAIQVTLAAGQTRRIEMTLDKIAFLLDEVVVREPVRQRSVSQQSLTSLEIKRLPGTGGDALRALAALPGISVANDFSGELYIRGGGPEDNVFYFDGVPLGFAYHFGGLVSTISTEVIDRVDVYAGGFGAEFGANAQAVIDITSRANPSRDWTFKANLNMLYSELFLEGPLGDRGSWYLAGRRSYIDLFPIQVERITRFPRFWDYQANVRYPLSEHHELRLSAFAADDVFQLNLDLEDVNDDPTFAGTLGFQDRFNAQAIHLRSRFGDRISSELSLSRFERQFSINLGQGFFLRIRPTEYQLREDLTLRTGKTHQLETGLLLSTGPRRASSFFPRAPDEGDPSFDFTFEEKLRIDTEARFDFIEGYVQSRYTPFPFLSLTLGMRLDTFNLTDQLSWGPRASLEITVPGGAKLRAAYGHYEQAPQPYQILPEVGNPELTDSRADHYIVEIERPLSPSTKLKVAAFTKRLDRLITRDPDVIYRNQADGFARGVEFSVNHRAGDRLFAWANYAYSVSKRHDRPGEPERLYSFDQPHVGTLTVSYKITPTWEIGAKWQYASGNPYTPVVGTIQKPNPISGKLTYVPIYGEKNSKRYPPVHRLDLRISKRFDFGGWRMGVYLELFNAYNRKNVLQYDYNEDYTELEEVNTQLPLLPYLGWTIEF